MNIQLDDQEAWKTWYNPLLCGTLPYLVGHLASLAPAHQNQKYLPSMETIAKHYHRFPLLGGSSVIEATNLNHT